MAELRPHLDAPPPPHLDLQAALQHAATGVQTDPYFPKLRLRLRSPAANGSASASASAASASASAASVGTSAAAAAASASAYDAWRHLSLQLEVEGPLKLLLHPRNAQRCGDHFALTTQRPVSRTLQRTLQRTLYATHPDPSPCNAPGTTSSSDSSGG